MALSQAIEYLLTIKTPEGRQIVRQAVTQVIVPFFLAGRTARYEIPPAPGDYANIVYQFSWSDEVNPNVFRAVVAFNGVIVDALLTSDWLREKVDIFGIVTRAITAHGSLTNITGLNQFYSHTVHYLSIRSEKDFAMVFDKLQHADISAELNKMLVKG